MTTATKPTAPTCIAIPPGTMDTCGAPATHGLRFSDFAGPAPTCEPCALRLQQQWQAGGAHLPVERLEP